MLEKQYNLGPYSAMGFGGAAIGNLYRPVSEANALATVCAAVDAGVRYFDTAPHYGFGLSEKRLGLALQALDPQTKLVISTKVGRLLVASPDADLSLPRQGFISTEPFESTFDYSYDGVMRSYESSCKRLGRNVQVLYAHDLGRRVHGEQHPALFKQFLTGGYLAMRRLRDAGEVRAIGFGVNEWQVCEEALAHIDLDIVLLAGRYTLLEQGALETFLPLCASRGVSVVIGGPYNSGILARGVRASGVATYDYQSAPADILLRVGALEAICERHGVPLAAAALQFPLAHPQVVSVVPGASSADEVTQAARWLAMRIPADFWHELRAHGLLRFDAPVPVAA